LANYLSTMHKNNSWQPAARLATLQTRAAMLASARKYFADRSVLEVETPVIASHSVTDPHIQSIGLHIQNSRLWLRTSPEYHMKRLLAAYPQDIYQIAKVFRDGESGTRHQPEFTMIEWYRLGFDLTEIIADTCQLITNLSQHGKFSVADYKTISYTEAFQTACNLNPLSATLEDVRATAMASLTDILDERLVQTIGDDRACWLDLLASHIVTPSLEKDVLHVVKDYPAEQAMLAKLNPNNGLLAERFEVFLNGVELANGYCELQDAHEQTERFQRDNERRRQSGMDTVTIDEHLLAALESGLPACSGVALGLDRLLMITDGHDSVAATLGFLPGS
jgi:lysyl-tRNA synthetase class 2